MRPYNPGPARRPGLGCFRFARHYSGNHYCFLFLWVLRCFSSPGWLSFEWHAFSMPGCPIRKPMDVTLVCSSPWLIAAYRVLRRLSDPRHPPFALICFKKFISIWPRGQHDLFVCLILLFQYIPILSQYVKELEMVHVLS